MTKRAVDRAALVEALSAAGAAHHDFEARYLGGEYDVIWPGWYAAYVLGRLGDFVQPTELSEWLRDAPSDGVWAEDAATFVLSRMEEDQP